MKIFNIIFFIPFSLFLICPIFGAGHSPGKLQASLLTKTEEKNLECAVCISKITQDQNSVRIPCRGNEQRNIIHPVCVACMSTLLKTPNPKCPTCRIPYPTPVREETVIDEEDDDNEILASVVGGCAFITVMGGLFTCIYFLSAHNH